jgi:hypothetical protein
MKQQPGFRLANWVPNVSSLVLIGLLVVNYVSPFADLDFTWQVRTGEQIVRTGQLRTPESFSYTIAGEMVPDFEWLYEVILWLVWSIWGFGGLKFLKILLIGALLALLAQQLRSANLRWHGIAAALLLAVFVLAPAWNLRPLYATSIGLLLVSGWLHDHCTGRRPLTWWLPVVMLLWGNLHPGVITGQGLLAGAIAWEWLNRWLKLNEPISRAACWRLTSIGGLGLAATFLSPDPMERLLYPFQPELRHPIFRIFSEMRPLYTFVVMPPFQVVLAYGVALLVLLSVVLRFRQYRLWEVALLAGLSLLANLAYRSLQDWLLVMLALGMPHLVILLRQAVRTDRRRWWVAGLLRLDASWRKVLHSRLLRWQPVWPCAAFAGLAVASLLPPLSRRMPIQDSSEWPAAALDHIEELGLTGRFFAPPDFGSYLTWRLQARAKCYVDTRGFFFRPELIEDSHFVPQLGPDWRRRLDRILDLYETDYLLLETTGPRGQLWQVLRPHLGAPLYCDDQSVVLTSRQVREAVARLERSEQAEVSRRAVTPLK